MRSNRRPAAGLAGIAILVGCGSGGGSMGTFTDSASYAIGMNMAASLERTGAEVDVPSLVRGLTDALEGDATQITEGQADTLLRALATRLDSTEAANREEMMEDNKQKGDAFRAENAAKPGVVTTPSGLQYEVLEEGDGPRPSATDRVRVHYRGTLIDGTEFDSSYERGNPVTFPLNGVIPGWTEALQLMPVGSKYRIVLPPELGYGSRGSPPVIPPNATLVFEVELLGIAQ